MRDQEYYERSYDDAPRRARSQNGKKRKKKRSGSRGERVVVTLLSLLFLTVAAVATVKYVVRAPEPDAGKESVQTEQDGTQDEDEWLAQTGTTLSGNWADDLLAVAESQLGYEQSERNFQLDDADGETVRHYTRYGNDYGNDYGPWDVMFLSYCLKYADIPQSAIPQVSSVLSLHSQLRSALYNEETGSGYAMDFDGDLPSDAAMPGDIVIYNGTVTKAVAVESEPLQVQDDSADADIALLSMDAAATTDTAPHIEEYTVDASTVGIVSDVDEDFGTLTVISGDVDGKVAEVTLNASQVTTLVSVANAHRNYNGPKVAKFLVR